MNRILFLQKSDVLVDQQTFVTKFIEQYLPGVDVTFAGHPSDIPESGQFDIIITPTLPWFQDALNKLSGYRWIHFLSAGVEKIWSMPFDKTQIIMSKSSGVHGSPMSEYAIGAMLYFAKSFGRFQRQSDQALWHRTWLDELTNTNLTILGLGHIGQCIAKRAKAFDMHVTGTLQRLRKVDYVDRVLSIDEIEDALIQTDYLVICLPLTDATQGLVNDQFLSKLKKGAVLIDISRGGVVIGESVINALNSGVLKGAALDVFENQPLPPDSELWRREDILITPHVSGTTPFYLERALEVFVKNYHSLRDHQKLITPVNIDLGY